MISGEWLWFYAGMFFGGFLAGFGPVVSWYHQGVIRRRRGEGKEQKIYRVLLHGRVRGFKIMATLVGENDRTVGTFFSWTRRGAVAQAQYLAAQLKVWQSPPPRDIWRDTVTISI